MYLGIWLYHLLSPKMKKDLSIDDMMVSEKNMFICASKD